MGSRRNIGYLLLVLIVAGAAVAFNLYADDEAQKIVENAPEEQAEAAPEIDQARCEREQAEFETIWDASIENPNDPSYEEQLEIALTEVNAACGIE